jgi:hypothetical protein
MTPHQISVHFSTIHSSRDNAIQNWHTSDWYQLRDQLLTLKHVITETKEVTLISPWKYKTKLDNYTPRMTDDGEFWMIDGQAVVGRLASNVIGTSMLFFDFDGDLSISHAKQLFSTYTHLGYTSYSHMSPKKDGKDCFRIVVPLAQFVTAEQLINRRQAIYATFPGIDTSCLSLSRSFYVPSCARERAHLAQLWDNDGELFDVMSYEPEAVIAPIHTAVIDRPVDHQKFVGALKNIHLGQEPEWFKVACAMYSNGFTFNDFCEVSIGHLMHEKDQKDCKDKWKSAERSANRGVTPTMGYLVNLLKRHGQWKSSTDTKIDVLQKTIATLRSAA